MWEWFTTHSVWILVAFGFLLFLLFFFGEWVRENIVKKIPEERRKRSQRIVTTIFRTAEGIVLGIVAVAFIALTLSREGVKGTVTPETIQGWFLEHGTSILIILVVGVGVWYAFKRSLPALLQRAMAKPRCTTISTMRSSALHLICGPRPSAAIRTAPNALPAQTGRYLPSRRIELTSSPG